ncbi:hypothetical protein ABTX35_40465, partial [Streptomyces sp. NPDC096080]|uniref:hypothetical protein n=1 Tax=Streptomyces sp. NPDC096080 TaxID=3156693 RepID=UPI00331C4564
MRSNIARRSSALLLGPALVLCGLALGAPAASAAVAEDRLPAEECKVESINFGFQQAFPGHPSAAASVGTLRAQALFVDFPDRLADDPDGEMMAALLRIADTEAGELEEQSDDRLDLSIQAHESWLTLPSPTTAYPAGPGDVWTGETMTKITTEAIGVADPVVDFTGIDVVWVFYHSDPTLARRAAADNDEAWLADGHEITRRVVLPTSLLTGTVLHETGHTLGLPDLYDVDGSILPGPQEDVSRFIGQWDPMSYADGRSQFIAWTLWRLGWIDDDRVFCVDPSRSTRVALQAVEQRGQTALAVIRTERFNGLAIESRRPEPSPDNADEPQQSGVLIYRVIGDTTSGSIVAQAADGR